MASVAEWQIAEDLAVAASEDEVEQSVQDCFAELVAVQGSSAGNHRVELVADLGCEDPGEVAAGEDPKQAAELGENCSATFARSEQLHLAQAGLWLPRDLLEPELEAFGDIVGFVETNFD